MLKNLQTNICHYICDNSTQRYQQYRIISLCTIDANFHVLFLITTKGKMPALRVTASNVASSPQQ